jgi:hypothetical protein
MIATFPDAMYWTRVPREEQARLIINTDAKNEADDRYGA